MNVLVINGHPRKNSFSSFLADAYIDGSVKAGCLVRRIDVAELDFELNVLHHSPRQQVQEQSIEQARQNILWAQHLVFIFPTWWGTMPALLKGFIDRVFTAGFAFNEIEGGTGYEPLLRGRTAQIVTTMDTPRLVYSLLYRSPGINALKRATLGFCGIKVTGVKILTPVKDSTAEKRSHWLQVVNGLGNKLSKGATSSWQRLMMKVGWWLKAVRLQFYPMTFVAYASGAAGAAFTGHEYSSLSFWIGYLWLFFLEVATVLSNDYFDFQSDKTNRFFSAFSGGSRVIVEQLLSFKEMKRGIYVSLALAIVFFAWQVSLLQGNIAPVLGFCCLVFVVTLGYTVPPLKLCYRGLGEFDVALTHSFAVVVCGYLFQGGVLWDAFPWLLSIPLFLAVLPSIILAGIPDHDADKQARKRTLAVNIGIKRSAMVAMAVTIIAAITVVVFQVMHVIPQAFTNLGYAVVPHAVVLCFMLYKYISNPNPPRRIDKLLVASLTYLVWFGLIPLINLK